VKKQDKTLLVIFCISAALVLSLPGCKDHVSLPKPKAWPRIDLPQHAYQSWGNKVCPFSFDIPGISRPDSVLEDSCWMNFYIEPFNCWWHITYRHIPSSGKSRGQHLMEYHNLVYKHSQKSSRIVESPVRTKSGDGVFYELFGDVGVPAQFIFGNDKHLVMNSFYFPRAVNGDSLAPVIDFVKEDMHQMIRTISWKN
jgi:gliding motility-associated lipoprotein GldD